MSTILLPELSEKHYSRKIAGDVGEICEPLRGYGITFFLYARLFNDGTLLHLTQNWDALHYHYKKQHLISPPISNQSLGNKFFFLPSVIDHEGFNKANSDWRNLFNIDIPIYFIEHYHQYMELIIYSSTSNNHEILNFYLNNIDILEKFKFYFRDKANKLIAKSNKNKIQLPKEMYSNLGNINVSTESVIVKRKFLKHLEVKNYILPGKHQDISLSSRELDVIKELANGCTLKETGKTLDLSPRTVETHLNNLKSKLKLQRKTEIIKLISDLNLLRL